MKRIGLTASEEKSFENVDDGQRTDDDGYLYILKAHLRAFGSGELKISQFSSENYLFYSREKLQYITWMCFRNKISQGQTTYNK